MTGPELAAIAGAATVLAVTPGPETILTVRLSALRRKAGLIYSLGSATGMTVWMIAALTGVSALLRAYPSALLVLKLVGGLYLCLLGFLAARQALRIRAELRSRPPLGPVSAIAEASDDLIATAAESAAGAGGASGPDTGQSGSSWGHLRSLISYRRGLISSLSNPKAGLFFLAVMPTLVPASPTGPDYAVLIAVVVGLLLAYQLVLALVAGYAAAALQRRSTDFVIEAVSAVVLIGMGIAVAALPL
ncbi:threonine efflux protein [Brevibacterium sanguinis]|uniref:Threonine efflux protein n=2 Tax=Brevibacterium TaxID=1696 RepID=A0A366IPD3_9MICO|nr:MULTISPECIES: LysE family translocator [Brevibacterium]RBP68201.1 threonine efflux protein [Brevibacterium sanguinis]RBP74382.1 threonine efflux protein [Brevibacterium celere]